MEGKRIGLFTPPLDKAGLVPFTNLIDLILSVSHDVSIVSGNEALPDIYKKKIDNYKILYHTPGKSQFSRMLKFFSLQIQISIYFLKFNKHIDLWVFFLGGEIFILPLILARFLKKPVFCVLSSSPSQMLFHDRQHRFITYSGQVGYFLANKIIVYSSRLISEWNLEPYSKKILIAQRHFVDFDTFTITTLLSDRPLLIGYIGRLSEEKGVNHFIQALPKILKTINEVRVLIGGDGRLKKSIEISLEAEKISDQVCLVGWISHDDLPYYLNQIRLLVLPSYTEGLPNIMLESMACGTPVLATPVGAIPEIIIDGETGFIMEDNSSENIAKNVRRAMDCPNLARIAENARQLVLEKYTFEKTVDRWRRMFNDL